MAGEIEDPPFSYRFQANSLHSGSISFGRFETESLCWERRSSFSHNRYLEEVEKYSKPGSVTEKKAYFEAHFKRRALLSRSSSEDHIGSEYQTSENDVLENIGYTEEIEHLNEGQSSGNIEINSGHSENGGKCEAMLCEKEEREALFSQPQAGPVFDLSHEQVKPEEAYETVPGNAESEIEVLENLNRENADTICQAAVMSPHSETQREDHNFGCSQLKSSSSSSSSKSMSAAETKPTKPGVKSKGKFTPPPRKIPIEAPKDFIKEPSRREKGVSLRTENAKHASPTTARMTRSTTSRAHECNSNVKELRNKKVADSALEKVATKAAQTSNRPKLKPAVRSSNQSMKQSSGNFKFKSDERAERRKEFNMKFEEKINAKESKMNQIQAKTLILQRKTEADIKQFRRSLNFKATPMPSFYHEPVSGSDKKNKAVSSIGKSVKHGKESPSKLENKQALCASKPVNTTGGIQRAASVGNKLMKGQKSEMKQKLRPPVVDVAS